MPAVHLALFWTYYYIKPPSVHFSVQRSASSAWVYMYTWAVSPKMSPLWSTQGFGLQGCLWSPVWAPRGQQKTLISTLMQLLTADLHQLSPTAEAQVRTPFRLINLSKGNNKVCSYRQTSKDFLETSFF